MNGNSYLQGGNLVYFVHFKQAQQRIEEKIAALEVRVSDRNVRLHSSEFIDDLLRLRHSLAAHFREEAEGCFDDIVARNPKLSSDFKEIERAQATMLRQLDLMIDEVGKGLNSERWRERVAEFHRQFLSHARQELEQIQHCLNLLDDEND